MEIVRYLTLAGIVFSIGVYGALTRRSFAGALLSLSISAGAIALALVTFNRLIQPSETNGYFFGLSVLALSVVYGALAAQFVRHGKPRRSLTDTGNSVAENFERINTTHPEGALASESPTDSTTTSKAQMKFARRAGEGFVGIASFTDSFAFQVSVMIVFVVGYLLMRLAIPAAVAFVLGVGALAHILHRRKREENLKKKSAAVVQPIVRTKVSKL